MVPGAVTLVLNDAPPRGCVGTAVTMYVTMGLVMFTGGTTEKVAVSIPVGTN